MTIIFILLLYIFFTATVEVVTIHIIRLQLRGLITEKEEKLKFIWSTK